jgi:H+/Cl- antiporter ClcA
LKKHLSRQDLVSLVAAFATGLAATAYAALFRLADGLSRQLWLYPWSLLWTTPACFLVGWWLVKRWAPEAKGSGIPQVMAAIESMDGEKASHLPERLLSLRVAVVKVLSSFFCVLGGGAVGREGPTIQIAASIFYGAGRRSGKSDDANRHFGLIAGGAAGIAAAFNTPLGGLVYGIEELASDHFNRFKTSLIASVIVAGLVAQGISGSYLYIGVPALTGIGLRALPWALALGAFSGLGGALFGRALFWLVQCRKRLVTSPGRGVWTALGTGLAVALLAILVEPRSLGAGREVILGILFRGETADLKLLVCRFFSPLISYFSGCAGGVFAPSLAAGGILGSLAAGWAHSPYGNLFVLFGMAGFLTGVTRAPFTSFVLVLEMTDRHIAVLLLMAAALAAHLASRLLEAESFYERVKRGYFEGGELERAGVG